MKGFQNKLKNTTWVGEYVGVNMKRNEEICIILTVVRVNAAICKINKKMLLFATKIHCKLRRNFFDMPSTMDFFHNGIESSSEIIQ